MRLTYETRNTLFSLGRQTVSNLTLCETGKVHRHGGVIVFTMATPKLSKAALDFNDISDPLRRAERETFPDAIRIQAATACDHFLHVSRTYPWKEQKRSFHNPTASTARNLEVADKPTFGERSLSADSSRRGGSLIMQT